MRLRAPLLAAALLAAAAFAPAKDFSLTILHTNDMHAHAEATKIKGKLYGGYAKLATLIRQERAKAKHSLLLNAGDTFQGTLYFNTYEGLSDLTFMNAIGFQAACVGNHEFDRGAKPLGTFARLAQFPILAANLDVSAEPALRDVIKPSAVVTVDGQKIGLVGAVTPDVPNISNVPDTVKMRELTSALQGEIDRLKRAGIQKIFLITHIGYEEDIAEAGKLHGVSVIIGGHSHTLLGSLTNDGFASHGAYPTVVENADHKKTLVVQAWEWAKVLGELNVVLADDGSLKSWSGKVLPVTEDTPDDPEISTMMTAFQRPILALKNQPVGSIGEDLTRERGEGRSDSTMGNVMADSMLAAAAKQGAVAAFTNAGGVRAGLDKGPVKYGQLIEVEPFGNSLVTLELTGAEVKAAIEEGVSTGGMLYPSAGTSYTIDPSKPAGSRVTQLTIAGKPMEPEASYVICFNSFTAGGGDSHVTLKSAKGKRVDTGLVDLDALIDYVKTHPGLTMPEKDRIKTQS